MNEWRAFFVKQHFRVRKIPDDLFLDIYPKNLLFSIRNFCQWFFRYNSPKFLLGCGGTSKRNKELPLFRWSEWTATSGARGGRAKISEVGRSKTQDTPPNHDTNTEYDPLLEGQPVEYIKHVGRYVSSSRIAWNGIGMEANVLLVPRSSQQSAFNRLPRLPFA